MSEENAAQLNKPVYEGTAIRIPQALCRRGVKGAALFIAGEIFSFSNDFKPCRRTHDKFKDNLDVSSSTVVRGIKKLEELDLIESVGKSAYKFKPFKSNVCLRFELVMATTEFYFREDKKRNKPAETRKFTYSEDTVFAWLYNKGKDGKVVACSVSEIAAQLNLSKKTVNAALLELRRANLIFMTEKGVNASVRSEYKLHNNYVRRLKKTAKRAAKAAQTDEERKAARESYYYDKRARAETRADFNRRRALKDETFKTANSELNKLAIEEGKAEALNLPTLPELQAKRRELERQRAESLKRLNLRLEDLEPQYECKLCNDTGYDLKTGRPCSCYNKTLGR